MNKIYGHPGATDARREAMSCFLKFYWPFDKLGWFIYKTWADKVNRGIIDTYKRIAEVVARMEERED